jgi:orotate phosphoribosyltransferase
MADSELTRLARAIDARSRLHGSFVLRSGQVSDEYFDKYLFEADPVLLRGLELGGVPIATMLSQLTGMPTLFIRKQPKEYGTRKLAEGDDPAGRHVVLVEDVITTGGAVLAAATALRDIGATVSTVVCAIDRSAPGQSVLPAGGVSVRPVLTKADLDAVQTVS